MTVNDGLQAVKPNTIYFYALYLKDIRMSAIIYIPMCEFIITAMHVRVCVELTNMSNMCDIHLDLDSSKL